MAHPYLLLPPEMSRKNNFSFTDLPVKARRFGNYSRLGFISFWFHFALVSFRFGFISFWFRFAKYSKPSINSPKVCIVTLFSSRKLPHKVKLAGPGAGWTKDHILCSVCMTIECRMISIKRLF